MSEKHEVRHVALTYETPGLRTGAIVSLAALAVLLVWTFAARRARRNRRGA